MREAAIELANMLMSNAQENIDRLVQRAREGDHASMVKAFELIRAELEIGSARSIQPSSLEALYLEVQEGIKACSRTHFMRSRLAAASNDWRMHFVAVVEYAVMDWFHADHKGRPPYNPNLGGTLAQYAESQALVHVLKAIAYVGRRVS